VKRLLKNIRAGRMQKLLALTTAVSAPPLALEIYLEHYKGSFGDKWMWAPIAVTPPLTAAGIAGYYSERAAKTWLNGLIGTWTHLRGIQKRPGGFQELTYNLVMGPPPLAPGSLCLVGAMGIAAAVMRREK
jgi:hypothetical protein